MSFARFHEEKEQVCRENPDKQQRDYHESEKSSHHRSGQVSPVGNDVATAWSNLLAGKSGIGRITRFDASDINSQIAGEVRDFDIGQYISAKEARRMDVFIHYGIAAALQAINDSGLDDLETLDKDRVGVNIGSGIGGLPSIEATGKAVLEGARAKSILSLFRAR